MTPMTDLERRLAAWLDDDGPVGVPAGVVAGALARAAGERQRSAWLIPEWWRSLLPRRAPSPAGEDALEPRLVDRLRGLPSTRPWPRVAWVLVALLALLALVGGLLGAGGWLRATSVSGFACPAGLDPDIPGPADQARPPADPYVWAEWAGEGRVLRLTGPGPRWTFDVCSNTWQASEPDALAPARGQLVFDDASGLLVAIGDDGATTLGPEGGWVRLGGGDRFGSQLGYDPTAELVIVRDIVSTDMWTFDPEGNTWLPLAQVEPVAPTGDLVGYQLTTYDAIARRFVLVDGSHSNHVWLLDPVDGRWTEQRGRLPPIDLFIGSDEMVYDPVGGRSLVFARGRVYGYVAAIDRWDVLFVADPDDARLNRSTAGVAFDPVNERLVVIGGSVWDGGEWVATDDVLAFDLEARTWIELLAPSAGGIP